MTERVQEPEPDMARRVSAGAGGRGNAGRRRSALWEFLGMALVASGLCLAVVSPDLRAAAVHAIAATAAELAS
ncbi:MULTISPECIES: hypothetical protein [unclassified Streptomyces]|uniref:hypothetical protein n=1 Tax=Streptomyces TaxID=1883 RepID=UPI00136D5E4C|nr:MULTISPECIES: hypothetical protein [unclassified Streptomyces]NEA05165.1 hypothetical protein [Streptomyces sp. SID10116]MYY87010.1 hypothetical protein [Streptomyces sp. SID335]MYZ19502.1 hypothetical protein [Streptomyces sp. SID337]NDZ88027.1 hypothetical protein [Streptomyces sp. SID10115]NEB49722.1 hypothetical protein [Streptomyces sp. SID339]